MPLNWNGSRRPPIYRADQLLLLARLQFSVFDTFVVDNDIEDVVTLPGVDTTPAGDDIESVAGPDEPAFSALSVDCST